MKSGIKIGQLIYKNLIDKRLVVMKTSRTLSQAFGNFFPEWQGEKNYV